MTSIRANIEKSLAERGRAAYWANEQESAVLAGFPADGQKFRASLPALERAGFPLVTPFNGKRFIPAIEQFIWRQLDELREDMPQSVQHDIQNYEDE